MLIPNHWYKDEYYNEIFSNEEVICNKDPNNNYNDTFTNTQKYTSSDHSEQCNKQISQNRIKMELNQIQEESNIRQEALKNQKRNDNQIISSINGVLIDLQQT
ncbi:9250_t:CDS:2 [Diversispora eburnea]|uniref:9250_t:CDS:1 n=1 Tax=Diversispora eburnea TaxID=1213867 RepID=A0A9N9CV82_9GLOM|nr:9250_t:CDS:2 [Diversispora eburnea]